MTFMDLFILVTDVTITLYMGYSFKYTIRPNVCGHLNKVWGHNIGGKLSSHKYADRSPCTLGLDISFPCLEISS